jgi:hypothetical protein
MNYFSGLDISMDETHICVLDREEAVVYESKTISTAEAIADELAKAPSCRRIPAAGSAYPGEAAPRAGGAPLRCPWRRCFGCPRG